VMACSGNNTGGSQATTGGAPGTGGTTAREGGNQGGAPTSGGSPPRAALRPRVAPPQARHNRQGWHPRKWRHNRFGWHHHKWRHNRKAAPWGQAVLFRAVGAPQPVALWAARRESGGAGGAGGKTGSGGSSAGGSSTGLTLDQSCSAMCASQASGACPVADCQTACVNAADATVSAVTKCNTQYTAMANVKPTWVATSGLAHRMRTFRSPSKANAQTPSVRGHAVRPI